MSAEIDPLRFLSFTLQSNGRKKGGLTAWRIDELYGTQKALYSVLRHNMKVPNNHRTGANFDRHGSNIQTLRSQMKSDTVVRA